MISTAPLIAHRVVRKLPAVQCRGLGAFNRRTGFVGLTGAALLATTLAVSLGEL